MYLFGAVASVGDKPELTESPKSQTDPPSGQHFQIYPQPSRRAVVSKCKKLCRGQGETFMSAARLQPPLIRPPQLQPLLASDTRREKSLAPKNLTNFLNCIFLSIYMNIRQTFVFLFGYTTKRKPCDTMQLNATQISI